VTEVFPAWKRVWSINSCQQLQWRSFWLTGLSSSHRFDREWCRDIATVLSAVTPNRWSECYWHYPVAACREFQVHYQHTHAGSPVMSTCSAVCRWSAKDPRLGVRSPGGPSGRRVFPRVL